MSALEILVTSDGSHTLRNTDLNETYHSVHGAIQESLHVFIKNGLQYFHEQRGSKTISILEVGFGTGLNALLSLRYAVEHALHLRYTTLEPYPLPKEVWSNLNYGSDEQDREYFRALHEVEWEREVSLAPEFAILKHKSTLQDAALTDRYDIVYFDAFAPAVQPELWAYASLRKVTKLLDPAAVFVTYSARGQLKRDLRSLGLVVESLPGPPGKNEIVRAIAGDGL